MSIRTYETIFITGGGMAAVNTWIGRGKLISNQLKVRRVDHVYSTGGESAELSTVSVDSHNGHILTEILAMPELRFSVESCGDVGGFLLAVCDSAGRNTDIYFDKKNLAHAEKLCATLNELSPFIQL